MSYGQRIFTRREVEGRIANGDTLVISNNTILRLNGWQDRHPGGRFVIQHMVGRDATDELAISHSLETLQSMQRYRIGRVVGPWKNFVPPIQGGVFRKAVQHEEVDSVESVDNDEHEHAPSSSSGDDSSSDEPALDSDLDRPSYASSCSSVELDASTSDLLETLPLNSRKRLAHAEKKTMPMDGETREDFTARVVAADRDADIDRYPSLDAATQRSITLKFRELHQRVHDEGYYDCRYMEYVKEVTRYSMLFGLSMYALSHGWYLASGVALGFFWQQIMFSAHDSAHRGITHNFVIDTLIAIFIGDFCCGLSVGWWKSSHNVHHFVTNDPIHDPDIQNVPLFATSPKFFSSIKSSYYDGFCFYWDAVADFTVKYQVYTYYPIMAVARFNLYFLSWLHLASNRSIRKGSAAWTRPVEIISILCFLYLYGYLLVWRTIPTWTSRVVFVLASHIATLPLHVQITLSHWGTSTSDFGPSEAFAQRQLRTTMDVDCPEWLDFIHGGLQFQAVHHLFPRVPRHNLRRLQTMVKEFCNETGIEYLILGFVDGNKDMLSKLQHITDQAKILAACQAHMAATGESGLH